MRLADAWALLPELAVRERDPARELRQLETLACWAGSFTSEVSLALPDALLLEVRGSLRLFGGIEALLARILGELAAQGHATKAALAPTPYAALWLAAAAGAGEACEPGEDRRRAGVHAAGVPRCLKLSDLSDALAPLPLDVLSLDAAQRRRLAGFGVRRIGDLLGLPRSGLARRFGAGFVTLLAQALGELPDLRRRYRFPETFRQSLELPARVEDAARLLFAARRLVHILCGRLAARSSGVARCELLLEHERGSATALELFFASATRDPERIARVLRERLERLPLPAPVERLVLAAESPEPLPGRESGLFGENAAAEGVMSLVERLRARLGEGSVHALALRSEHRPELASVPSNHVDGSVALLPAPRPCWLLAQPQPLAEIDGCPQRNGPLKLLAGPERIESGWWDAGEENALGEVRRDYFVAFSRQHEWLWIFRDTDRWFLHGFFA